MPGESKFGEPWNVVDARVGGSEVAIVDKDDGFILGHSSDEGALAAEDPRWNRIVACVNFCREIPTDQLDGICLQYASGDAFPMNIPPVPDGYVMACVIYRPISKAAEHAR